MKTEIKVLVADDSELFRQQLCKLLELEEEIEVVGEAADGVEAISKAESLVPDVVLMDIKMPRKSGIEAAGEIKKMLPATKVIMLTVCDEEAYRTQVQKVGANGYLVKGVPVEELMKTIRTVGRLPH